MIDRTGQQLGNYRLTRLLGEGGFAEVYLGEHIYLDTQAAIKVLQMQLADEEDEWFRTEARILARLIHPNIVRVLDFGIEDTTPFLVLDYAPNGTLRQRHPKGTSLALSTVVSYVTQVAEALQYAHDEKLVHRDVKPDNMLLGRRNEVLLSDFGTALVAQSSRSLSLQDVAGTLFYMAPEQIQGKPRPASDQYSLGIVVYEWLSGVRPFDGTLTEVISQQIAVPPQALRLRMPAVSPAVEQVVMRALEKDPNQRFKNIREFAMALEQASRAQRTTAILADTPVIPPISEVQASGRSVTLPPVRPPGIPAVDQAPLTASIAQPAASRVQAGTILSRYGGHASSVRSLAWSPDSLQIISVSGEKTVHVWDVTTGNNLQLYADASDAVYLVAWSPDGLYVATAGSDALVRVWERTTNRLLATYSGHTQSTVQVLAWSPQQPLLASTGNNGSVHIWEATSGQAVTIYDGHAGSVRAVAWSPDGKRMISGGADTSVQIWEASTGKNLVTFAGPPAQVVSTAWSPGAPAGLVTSDLPVDIRSGSRVACSREDGTMQMWDTGSQREVLSYRYSSPVSIIAWSPDGRRFAFASGDQTVQVWNTITNLKLFTFYHTAPVRVMAWSPNGKYIASGGDDAVVQVWAAP